MPIHAVCPECEASYDLVDEQRGKKVRCKKCQAVFEVGLPAKPKREAPRREVEAVAERPVRAARKDFAAPARNASRRDDDDDDDDREERRRPVKKKKGGSLAPLFIVGGLAAVFVVLLVGGGILYAVIHWANKDSEGKTPHAIVGANNPAPPIDNHQEDNGPGDHFPQGGGGGPPVGNPNPNPNPGPGREPVVKDLPAEDKPSGKPAPGGGQLAADVLRRVKHATAMIRVTMPDGGKAWGSGFLAYEPNTLLTNAHVIGMLRAESRPPSNIEVILDSGEKAQRAFQGNIVGVDRESDLAVLKLTVLANQTDDTIPPPLEVHTAGDLVETQSLYVFGFPLGEQLGKEITIRRAEVASLRKKNGAIEKLQVNGGIDPGNSGGPVVDANGDVVGVAVAKIRGTNIDFAIPGDKVKSLLQGRITEMGVHQPYLDQGKVHAPVKVHMMDPLRKVKEVAVDVWTGDPKFEADQKTLVNREPVEGVTPKVEAGDSTHVRTKLTYANGEASGELEFPALPPGKVYYVQPNWVNAKGTAQWASGSVHTPAPPVERKSIKLVLKQARGERNLQLKTTKSFTILDPDGDAHVLALSEIAALKENTTSVDRTGATMTLSYNGFSIDATLDKEKPPPDIQRRLEVLRNQMARVTATMTQDTWGNLKQGEPNIQAVPAQHRESVRNMHEQIQQSLEALAVSIPNDEVKYGKQWAQLRSVPVDTPGKYESGVMEMTYTYLGVRKNAAGREEAVLGLEGVVQGNDQKVSGKIGGKATGTAIVDVATGQVTLAHTTVSVDMTSSRGAKQVGTLDVTLQRPMP
jgi:predicted Zn finger-like uncharacterized protein